jgi:hypothetical protein
MYQRMMRDARDGQDINAPYNEFHQTIRSRHRHPNLAEAAWLLNHLYAHDADLDTTGFIATVLQCIPHLPYSFFEPLIRTAFYETNPSVNRYFVEPGVCEFGFERVAERFLEYLSDGTNFEKGGAVNAFDWVRDGAEHKIVAELPMRESVLRSTRLPRCIHRGMMVRQ